VHISQTISIKLIVVCIYQIIYSIRVGCAGDEIGEFEIGFVSQFYIGCQIPLKFCDNLQDLTNHPNLYKQIISQRKKQASSQFKYLYTFKYLYMLIKYLYVKHCCRHIDAGPLWKRNVPLFRLLH